MKSIIKTVYCCDYCDKKSLKSVLIHERQCLANPNRIYWEKIYKFVKIKKIKDDRLIQSYLTAMSAINLASFLLVTIQNETKDFDHTAPINLAHKDLNGIWEKLDKNLEFWAGRDRIEIDGKYIIIIKEKKGRHK